MKTYYLIDFENVKDQGLHGLEQLGKNDVVVVFFTGRAARIDMRTLLKKNDATVKFLEAPAGKQSADLCIASWIGFLVGRKPSGKHRMIIISRDTGFDNLIRFWNSWPRVSVSRRPAIAEYISDTQQASEQVYQPNNNKTDHKIPLLQERAERKPKHTEVCPLSAEERIKRNNAVVRALVNAGYTQQESGPIASLAGKGLKAKNRKEETLRLLYEEYGAEEGDHIYGLILDCLE